MTGRQTTSLATYLGFYAMACLAWEAYGFSAAANGMGSSATLALQTYDIPFVDAVMGYGSQTALRAGMSAAAVVALALAALAAFATQARGRTAQAALALAVGAYALSGLPASVPVLALIQLALDVDQALPLRTVVPELPFDGDYARILRWSDLDDALEAAVSLGAFLARIGAVAAAVGLLWPRGKAMPVVARHVAPTSGIPQAAVPKGGVRVSGG